MGRGQGGLPGVREGELQLAAEAGDGGLVLLHHRAARRSWGLGLRGATVLRA